MQRAVALLAQSLLMLAFAASWPMYLSKSWSAIDRYTHVHAFSGTLWLLAPVVQRLLDLRKGR
jgi:hypothetical protein